MAYDIGPRIGIEGEAEYKRAIAAIIAEQKKLQSELKLMESEFAGQLNSMEALTAKGEILEKQYASESQALGLLEKQLEAAETAKRKMATAGDALKDSIAAQRDVITQYKNALANSKDGTISLYDENGRLIQSFTDGRGAIERLQNELKAMERALESNASAQQSAANSSNKYESQLNETKVKLNALNAEIQQNKSHMAEAASSADRAASSIDRYGKEVKEADTATGSADGKSSSFFSTLKSGAGAVAGVATAMIALAKTIFTQVKNMAEAADELKRLEAETRLTTTTLQELQYIGDGVGVSLDTITGAIKRLINNMDMASKGTGEAYDAFEALGVSFRDSVTGELLNSTEVFESVIDALNRMRNETERDAIAQDLLGKSATELNPLIEAGSAAMREMADESHKANAIMKEETVNALDEAGDRLDHFWQTFKATLGEAIVATGNWLAGNKKATGESIDTLTSLGDKIDAVEASYDAVYLTSLKSLQGQIDKWDDLSGSVDKTFGQLKLAVDSQRQWYEEYSVNLHNLASRNVEGIERLVAALSDGTIESASRLAGFAAASDEELRTYLDNMAEVEDRQANLARYFAQIKTGANEQLSALYSGMSDSAKQLDASEKARVAGENTMNAYITAIRSKKEEVVTAFRDVADAAIQEGVRSPWQINSPSKVMQEMTAHVWDGMIIQTNRMREEVAKSFKDTAAAAERSTSTVIQPVYQEPARDSAAQTREIMTALSSSMSDTLKNSSGSGLKTLVIEFRPQLDGREISRGTFEYDLENEALQGVSLIER